MQNATDLKQTIILIGSEDSTCAAIGKSVAKHLAMPFLDLQESSQQYFDETDFDEKRLEQAWESDGINGVYQYMLPYDIHAIKRGVEEHNNCVIRIGALQAVFDDNDLLQDIATYLKPCSVVLLQPVEDKDESIRLVRLRNSENIDGMELNEYFLTHRSNFELAKHTVYTKDRTPEQTLEDILSQRDTDAKEIILIGAESVGKTTIGKLLSDKLGIPQVSMDNLRWKYYEEAGWSREQDQEIGAKEGFVGVFRHWKQFDVHAVERMLQEHEHCVIDFGAGHSVFENAEDLKRVREMLAPYANVFLIMPSPDMQESIAILRKRRMQSIKGIELIEFLISHASYDQLADYVVYTESKTPDECKDAVLEQLDLV